MKETRTLSLIIIQASSSVLCSKTSLLLYMEELSTPASTLSADRLRLGVAAFIALNGRAERCGKARDPTSDRGRSYWRGMSIVTTLVLLILAAHCLATSGILALWGLTGGRLTSLYMSTTSFMAPL